MEKFRERVWLSSRIWVPKWRQPCRTSWGVSVIELTPPFLGGFQGEPKGKPPFWWSSLRKDTSFSEGTLGRFRVW